MEKVNFKDYNSPFATRLRTLMNERNVKRIELAELLGVSRQSIGQYCDGTSLPPADKIIVLADYFDISTDYLLGRTDIKASDVDIKQVCEITGLSEYVVKFLNSYMTDVVLPTKDENIIYFTTFINELINPVFFHNIFDNFLYYFHIKTTLQKMSNECSVEKNYFNYATPASIFLNSEVYSSNLLEEIKNKTGNDLNIVLSYEDALYALKHKIQDNFILNLDMITERIKTGDNEVKNIGKHNKEE